MPVHREPVVPWDRGADGVITHMMEKNTISHWNIPICHYSYHINLELINKPGVAGAVLQTPLLLIHLVTDNFPQNH